MNDLPVTKREILYAALCVATFIGFILLALYLGGHTPCGTDVYMNCGQ